MKKGENVINIPKAEVIKKIFIRNREIERKRIVIEDNEYKEKILKDISKELNDYKKCKEVKNFFSVKVNTSKGLVNTEIRLLLEGLGYTSQITEHAWLEIRLK